MNNNNDIQFHIHIDLISSRTAQTKMDGHDDDRIRHETDEAVGP